MNSSSSEQAGYFQRLWAKIRAPVSGPVLHGVGVIAAAALGYLASLTTPVRFVEAMSQDVRIALAAPLNASQSVVVKIDDAAVEAMQAASPCHCLSPIDKGWLGQVIQTLDAKGARTLVIDYLLDAWRSPQELAAFNAAVRPVHAHLIGAVDPDQKPGVDYPLIPNLEFADARALVASDYDDVIRRYDPFPKTLPSLAAAAARSVGAHPRNGLFLIRYRRPVEGGEAENAGAVAPSFSAAYVAALPDALIRGKTVFIGRTTRSAAATADTIKEDMHLTPLRFLPGNYSGTPGVEIHAHAFAQLVAGDDLKEAGPWLTLAVVALGALIGGALGRFTISWWLTSVYATGAFAAAVAASFAALVFGGVVTPFTAPLLAFGISFFFLSRLSAMQLKDERAFYSQALERYLSPSVIDRIVGGAEQLSISAELRDITVIISDLENFSTLVAQTELRRFSEVMNAYFGELTEILWRHEALIDKMTGDGVIAIFGAPLAQPDHAARALACAREIDAFGEAFRLEQTAAGLKFGQTRMGVNSGEGLVGNFGGPRRFNYTAYGQVVVIAARLEAGNKVCGTRLLISRDTYEKAGRPSAARSLGPQILKGVDEAIEAFTLTDI